MPSGPPYATIPSRLLHSSRDPTVLHRHMLGRRRPVRCSSKDNTDWDEGARGEDERAGLLKSPRTVHHEQITLDSDCPSPSFPLSLNSVI